MCCFFSCFKRHSDQLVLFLFLWIVFLCSIKWHQPYVRHFCFSLSILSVPSLPCTWKPTLTLIVATATKKAEAGSTVFVSDDPPCILYFYKKPFLIPGFFSFAIFNSGVLCPISPAYIPPGCYCCPCNFCTTTIDSYQWFFSRISF